MINRLELQQGTTATHMLESQRQRWSEARIAARHYNHSPTGEPMTGMISRLELQQGTTATHILGSQGQAQLTSRLELQQGTTATHMLERQGQA